MNTSAIDSEDTQDAAAGGHWVQRLVLPCGVTLYQGDCLDILPTLEGVDAVVSDPPYGIGHKARPNQSQGGKTLRNKFRAGDAYGKHSGSIIGDLAPFDPSPWLGFPCAMWGAGYYHERLPRGGWLLWDKKCTGGYDNWNSADGDMAWMSREAAPRVFRLVWIGLVRGEVEKASGGQNRGSLHPNEKPVRLMAWTMDNLKVPEGATVLDPYMGSGTTGIACIRTGRNFIGIEKDPEHFETARKRIEAELAQGDLFRRDTCAVRTCACGNEIKMAAIADPDATECAVCYLKRTGGMNQFSQQNDKEQAAP